MTIIISIIGILVVLGVIYFLVKKDTPITTTSSTTLAPITTTSSTTIAPITTTSSTTLAVGTALIGMDNYSTDLIIGAVKVNSVNVNVIEGSLPLAVGTHALGTTHYLGVYNVTIAIDSGTAGQYITLSDSDSTLFCYNYNGEREQFDFTNVTINDVNILQLYLGDGICENNKK